MKKMYYFITAGLLIVCCLSFSAVQKEHKAAALQQEIARQVLRFHVRANSNSAADQELKLKVKDAVLRQLSSVTDKAEDATQTKSRIQTMERQITALVEEILKKEHCGYGMEMKIKKEHFPEKTYGNCTFPSGIYEGLIISLGEGAGDNWWCMLYPSLCWVDETGGFISEEKKEEMEQLFSEEAYQWILKGGEYKVSIRWDWLNNILNFPYRQGTISR